MRCRRAARSAATRQGPSAQADAPCAKLCQDRMAELRASARNALSGGQHRPSVMTACAKGAEHC